MKPGFTHEQFLQAEQTVRMGTIKNAKGYIGRELYKSENKEWTMILRFDSKENMDVFLAELKKARPESLRDYASMIDFATMRTEFAFNKM